MQMQIRPLFTSNDSHPLVVTSTGDRSLAALCAYMHMNKSELRKLLLRHGGLLFRGFDLNSAQDFRRCAESMGAEPFGYVGGNTPRTNVAEDVFTSTEYPASEVIGLHNEMSYLPEWPRRLFFYCLVPAREGGQTSLASSRDVLSAVGPQIAERLRKKQINYVRHFHSDIPLGRSWKATYDTEDRDKVAELVAQQGSACSWLPGDVLRVTTRREALATHPETGEELWFNQAEQWHPSALNADTRMMLEEIVGRAQMPHDCEYGDGQALEEGELAEIRQALNGSKLLFDWEHGDFLVIDNMLMMHGREAFAGERKTLAYLSAT
jgi:alpha-ketoglutarate-dependent taurine dioxygenase